MGGGFARPSEHRLCGGEGDTRRRAGHGALEDQHLRQMHSRASSGRFLLAGYDAIRNQQKANETAERERQADERDRQVAAIVGQIKEQVEHELPGWIEKTLSRSQDDVNGFIERTNRALRAELTK